MRGYFSAPIRGYQYPRLSRDGARAVVYSNDQEQDLWVWHMARAGLTRLTVRTGSGYGCRLDA